MQRFVVFFAPFLNPKVSLSSYFLPQVFMKPWSLGTGARTTWERVSARSESLQCFLSYVGGMLFAHSFLWGFSLCLRLKHWQALIFKAAPEAILVASVLLILPMSCEKWACHRTVSNMFQYWSQAAFSFVIGRPWAMSTPSLHLPLLAR